MPCLQHNLLISMEDWPCHETQMDGVTVGKILTRVDGRKSWFTRLLMKSNYHQSWWILCQGGSELIPLPWRACGEWQWHRRHRKPLLAPGMTQRKMKDDSTGSDEGATVMECNVCRWLSLCPWAANKHCRTQDHYIDHPTAWLSPLTLLGMGMR